MSLHHVYLSYKFFALHEREIRLDKDFYCRCFSSTWHVPQFFSQLLGFGTYIPKMFQFTCCSLLFAWETIKGSVWSHLSKISLLNYGLLVKKNVYCLKTHYTLNCDFAAFGDVVFDSTYRTNCYNLPFVPFCWVESPSKHTCIWLWHNFQWKIWGIWVAAANILDCHGPEASNFGDHWWWPCNAESYQNHFG